MIADHMPIELFFPPDEEANPVSEHREAPLTDLGTEGHLFFDRYKQAAEAEIAATWAAARERVDRIKASIKSVDAAVRPIIGLPSLVVEVPAPEMNRLRKALTNLGRLARNDFGDRLQGEIAGATAMAEIAPESGERKAA